MVNTVKNNVGSSAVAQSTETIEEILEVKTLWDIITLCNEASVQNEEVFDFVFENKRYSARFDLSYIIYELESDVVLGDEVGKVFIGDPAFSHFNGTIFG